MHYEINVSQFGRHYFATHERSLSEAIEGRARAMFNHFCIIFPAEDGYSVTLTKWDCSGHEIDERGAMGGPGEL